MSSARSIGIMTVLNVAGAVVGVVNSVVVAYFFGTTRALEVYLAASTLQMLVNSLTQTGQLAEVLLPLYHRIKHADGPAAAQQSFSIILNWMVLAVGGLSIALWIVAPQLVNLLAPDYGAADQAVATDMWRWLLPLLCGQVVVMLLSTLANAERKFGRPEAIGVGSQLAIVSALWAMARPLGAWALVWSLWIGLGLQLAGFAVLLRRMGYRHCFGLRRAGLDVAAVFRNLLATFVYAGTTQIWLFVLNRALTRLPQGVFAVFKQVDLLFYRTRGILLRPISIVFFTHISEAISKGVGNVRQLARQALARSAAIAAPACVLAFVAGEPVLAGLWGGKKFSMDNVGLAAGVLVFYCLTLFASAQDQISRKTVMSLGMIKRHYLLSAAVQVVSAAAAYLAIGPLGAYGAVGVMALNTVLLATVGPAVLALWDRQMLASYPPAVLWRWLAAGAAGCVAGKVLALWLGGQTWPGGRIGFLAAAGILGLAAMVATGLTAAAVNVYEVRELARRLWAKTGLAGRPA